MRNLKKYLAVLLVVIMTLTAMAPAFAAGFTYETQGAALKDLGIIEGVSATDLGLGLDLNREQGIKVVLGLVGKLDAAEALSAADAKAALAGFKDAADVTEWAVPYVAYAVKNKIVDGMDATTLAPKTKLSGKMFATLILRNLGYTVSANDYTNAASILADKGGLTAEQAKLFNDKNLIRDDMVGIAYGALSAKDSAGKTVIANLVAAGVVSAAKAEAAGLISGDVAVASVKAASASSFKVTFTNAVADISKVVITVKRDTTAMTLTPSWNEAKTEATLTYSANLPEASYTVAVKNDTKDLGSSTVAITPQKIKDIKVTSTKLAVVTGTPAKGYATYKVFDQYENDITSSYLANNITFQSGVSNNVTHKNGVITITETGVSLIQFANVVITGYDTTSGVSVTATLTTSTAMGTLADFQLGDVSNIKLTAGDVTSVFYIPYTATDISGNETKNFNLVKQGLILNGANSDELSVSNPDVKVKIVQDPADSTKAAVELKVTNPNNIMMDMPVTITAMTYTGKNSSVSTTLKRGNEVDRFSLMAPSFNIATGDSNKEIPFEAYDQAGNRITRYDDLVGKVTLNPDNSTSVATPGIRLVKNVDGSAKVVITPISQDGPQIVSVSVNKSGKLSMLTLNIQKAAVAETLELDSTVFVAAMENQAVQDIDFGFDAGGLKVKDQFGRNIDMTTAKATNKYKVKVTTSGAISGAAVLSAGNSQAHITANDVYGNGDSGTVSFELFNDTNSNSVVDANESIDTKSAALSVIKSSDIKDYTISAVTSAIYASNANTVAAGLKGRDKEYAANPKVYGKTAGGAKVVLANSPITGAYVDNGSEFQVTSGAAGGAYDAVKVTAGKLSDPTKTEASTTLTVTVKDSTGALRSLTTAVKSSTEAPRATDLVADVKTYIPGLTFSSDVVTIDVSNADTATNNVVTALDNVGFKSNYYMTNYDELHAATSTIEDTTLLNNRSYITFYAKDQYGKKGLKLSQFQVIATSGSGSTVSIDSDGKLTVGAFVDTAAEDSVTISAVTNNGLIKTIKIVIQN